MGKLRVEIVFSDKTFSFDKDSGLMNVAITNQSMADNTLPTYDIINAFGSLEIIDSDGSLFDYIAQTSLKSGSIINIYSDDVLKYKFESSRDWKYDVYDRSCKIQLYSNITKWQNVKVVKKDITYNVTAYDVYTYLKGLSGNYNFVISSEDIAFMQSISIPYFYLEENSLWEQWRKLCQLTQSQVYQDIESNVVVKRFQ